MIRMLLGVYKKVRKPSLYINIEGIKGLVRTRRWRVAFRSVPRQMNAQADDMCCRAEAAGKMVEYRGAPPHGRTPIRRGDSVYCCGGAEVGGE